MYNVFYTNCLQVSTSVRCLLPFGTDERELGQGYVRAKVFNQLHLPQDSQSAQVIERTFSHVFGLYCLLNGLILFHLAGITMLLLMLTNSTFWSSFSIVTSDLQVSWYYISWYLSWGQGSIMILCKVELVKPENSNEHKFTLSSLHPQEAPDLLGGGSPLCQAIVLRCPFPFGVRHHIRSSQPGLPDNFSCR